MKTFDRPDEILENSKKIHMVGIGGSGMCPIAEILHSKGYIITGSDNNESDNLKRIRNLGIEVVLGHSADNVNGAEVVIYSAAISSDNPELVEAARQRIPVMERSEVLGVLTRRFSKVIGVSGTHGKTTTSSIITQILYMCNYDPTAVIGGRLPIINANGRAGSSEYMVCESCEFVDTFLKLSPDLSVLLNIDGDHLDYFKTMDNLIASFKKFVSMSKVAVVNGDDPLCARAIDGFEGECLKFGLNSENDFRAENLKTAEFGMCFDVSVKGKKVTTITLSIPGKHNVYNALAAFAVAYYYGIEPEHIKNAIEKFAGSGRRFERLGEFGDICLVDDYAHHPTEISSTLKAARDLGYSKIVAVFQPFTFSRTELLKEEFINALSLADSVVLMPIMGSREVNITGIKSEDLAAGLDDCICVDTFEQAADAAIRCADGEALIITMGGGDIYKAAHIIGDKLK
ncbi:MAG: UDP-N-acetylmuramate--L-alanine ligase [bacterium]|nr:UDP-N-acetylmuramate--L-alanine ligase [bacterium]